MTTAEEARHQAEEALDCVSYRLRRTARVIAKRYDDALRPVGLRNTQFTMINALALLGGVSIGDLAAELATDSTTLTRNLAVLVRRGLVEDLPDEDGRVRRIRLTEDGRALLAQALPLWRAAQQDVLHSIDPDAWNQTRHTLAQVEAAATGE
jgi:DNA-binding MarR family transcriptional regulator